MKQLYQYIVLCGLLSIISLSAAAQESSYYSILSNYKIDCDKIQLQQGVEKELAFRLTNPAPIEPVFQVDVTLPQGITLIPVDTLDNLCITAGNAIVDYKYYPEENSIRLLVNNNYQNFAKSTNAAFAKVKILTTEDFVADGSITFSNMIFTLASDGKGYYGAETPVSAQPLIYIDSIAISNDTVTIKVDSNYQLSAAITPEYATTQKLKWTSKKPWVAEINASTGKVTARSLGETDIIVSTTDGTNLSDTCHVIVKPKIDSLKLNMEVCEIMLEVGEEYNISDSVTVIPQNMNNAIKYISLNPDVATIDEQGHIVAISNGVTSVAVQTTDGSNLLAMCKVIVGSGDCGLNGDFDGNGIIDVEDVNAMINIILKLDEDDPEYQTNLLKLKSVTRDEVETGKVDKKVVELNEE